MESAGAAVAEVVHAELGRLADGAARPGRTAGVGRRWWWSCADRATTAATASWSRAAWRLPVARSSSCWSAEASKLHGRRCHAQLERPPGAMAVGRIARALRRADARAAAAPPRADRRGDADRRRAARLGRVRAAARADLDRGRPRQRHARPRIGRRPAVRGAGRRHADAHRPDRRRAVDARGRRRRHRHVPSRARPDSRSIARRGASPAATSWRRSASRWRRRRGSSRPTGSGRPRGSPRSPGRSRSSARMRRIGPAAASRQGPAAPTERRSDGTVSRANIRVMFEYADAAVEAALGAGARYADARVMDRRHESMAARNGEVEGLTQEGSVGIGRARPHRLGLGLLLDRRPQRRGRSAAGAQAAAIARASASVPGARPRADAGRGAHRPLGQRGREDPLAVPLAEKGDLLVGATRAMKEHGADVGDRQLRHLGHHEVARQQSRATASTSTSSSAARRWRRHVNGEAETQRRSYPGIRGQYGTRGWELVRELDLPGNAPRIAEEARALLTAAACPSLDATDLIIGSEQMALQIHESVGHAVELDRILGWEAAFAGTSWLDLAQLGIAPVRQRPDEHHRRCDPARRARQLRLRRRGHAGAPGRHRARRHLGRRPLRSRLGRPRRPGRVRRRGARRRLQPPADGAHDERRPPARRRAASRR